MRKFLSSLIIILLFVLLVAFAVPNRHLVRVSFDPFDAADPELSATLPLFLLIILAATVGVIIGGFATWWGQRAWRRAARQHEADARAARSELADLRATSTRAETGRLPVPASQSFYAVSGRDKQGATL